MNKLTKISISVCHLVVAAMLVQPTLGCSTDSAKGPAKPGDTGGGSGVGTGGITMGGVGPGGSDAA